MRIMIANSNRRRIGGAEEYISRLIPLLEAAGHKVGFLFDREFLSNAAQIELAGGGPVWHAPDAIRVAAALRSFGPDVVYCNGMATAALEESLSATAPSVFSAHGYWGTCVSGTKSFGLPYSQPCERVLGPGCLTHYYPRRCGGLNPVTMLQDYREQTRRLEVLRGYDEVVVHSSHMVREYRRHGIQAVRIDYLLMDQPEDGTLTRMRDEETWRLLFMGRMTRLKGVEILIDALRLAHLKLRKRLHVTFAGEGPTRASCENAARQLCEQLPQVTCQFMGWVDEARRAQLLTDHDLLVVPSIWPEPFGMVGLEAAAFRIPSVAFAVGGIPEWLTDGRNGFLAAGDRPTASGLADAIVAALKSVDTYERLAESARQTFDEHAARDVLSPLLKVFEHARVKRT